MKRIDVVKKGDKWVAEAPGQKMVASAPTKEAAVKKTAAVARKDPDAVSVKIHKQDGKIRKSARIRASADPRKSKG